MNDDSIAHRGGVLSLDRRSTSTRIKSSSIGEAKCYFVDVVEHALPDDLALFEGGGKIWWDQCDTTITHLDTMIALVQKLGSAAIDDKSGSHAIASTPSSSKALMVKLHYADLQLCRLLDLVAAFRSSCQNGPKHSGKKGEEICRRLKLFKLHSDDLLQSITLLQKERRPFPNYLRPVPKGAVVTSHDKSREAEEDADERPFSG